MTDWQTTLPNTLSPRLTQLLNTEGSLTQAVRELAPDNFHLELLDEYFAPCNTEQQQALALNANKPCKHRLVKLYSKQQALFIGYTVIEKNALEKIGQALDALGKKALGDLLFTDPALTRTPLQFKALQAGDDLFEHCRHYLDQQRPQTLWARRSVFTFRQQRLLVHEVFLIA